MIKNDCCLKLKTLQLFENIAKVVESVITFTDEKYKVQRGLGLAQNDIAREWPMHTLNQGEMGACSLHYNQWFHPLEHL